MEIDNRPVLEIVTVMKNVATRIGWNDEEKLTNWVTVFLTVAEK